MPFALRRPGLLLRDLLVKRESPDLEALRAEDRPEAFVWKILPHAARTFSACIALLPSPLAKAAAVGYLYCRSLDSYEDLLPSHTQRERCLRQFVDRFRCPKDELPQPPPSIDDRLARDARDRTHVILVNRCALVDRVYHDLAADMQEIILDLVQAMAEGMVWSSRTFEDQGGALEDDRQLSRYCDNVLGQPTIFAARLLMLHYHGRRDLDDAHQAHALKTGEFVQLANITRDIEKDLERGIAYHPHLRELLGRNLDGDALVAEIVRRVREDLMLRALWLSPSYRHFIERLRFPAISLGRASAVLMLLFTDRYYRTCSERVGREPWPGLRSGLFIVLSSLPAVLSQSWSRRKMQRTEARLLSAI